ncbi:hypothetical protein BA177_14985 [Woeseia oceani]|uniref:Uncharacterized protein n=1 Tax=Woeseia oceani TaxID=1548547 RepID=A0A193LIH6_9GAMM|nr:hypothetical protein BA177_14985 [Woeseia oceani]
MIVRSTAVRGNHKGTGMHVLVLILAWITPAAIAGAKGWSGIWGTGSAFAEYLIPVPVAGGVFHVPSFVIAAGVILACRNSTDGLVRYLPVIGFGVLAASLSLMLDFDRLHAWIFTDYQPAGSRSRPKVCLMYSTECDALVSSWALVPIRSASGAGRFLIRSSKNSTGTYKAAIPIWKH